mgnify:CR=1 FL=1
MPEPTTYPSTSGVSRRLTMRSVVLTTVLALVLGDMAEASFRQAMLLSQGSLAIFWSNPLVGSIAGLAILMLVWPLFGKIKAAMLKREGGVVA